MENKKLKMYLALANRQRIERTVENYFDEIDLLILNQEKALFLQNRFQDFEPVLVTV